jgi:hypothetical protein
VPNIIYGNGNENEELTFYRQNKPMANTMSGFFQPPAKKFEENPKVSNNFN